MTVREIELIQSSIDNGRIYFPISEIKFFPTDSLADRERGGHEGSDVTFIAGGREYVGPIRVSSGQRAAGESAPVLRTVPQIRRGKGGRSPGRDADERAHLRDRDQTVVNGSQLNG